ncbi:MAG: TrkH family potassium uptake protein [Lachnospiraceae bacterium]|nr:TrkH family potassium uptake protein [Lachnospiraceae bacterium]
MNFRLIFRVMGFVLRCEAGLLALPALVSAVYGEWDMFLVFLGVIAFSLLASGLMLLKKPSSMHLQAREGFFAVAMTWIVLACVGAFPFYFSGYFQGYIDCVFEAMSGFTTTGSTILTEVESLPKGILFWRSFTHWVGGMGILVFVLGIMPNMDPSSIQLMKAESPGPAPGKLVPKLKDTARLLYTIYFVMTAVQILLLCMVGMPFYDSVIHAMGTAGTGGFSSRNLSVGAYNNVPAEMIIAVFMLLFGVNFNIYYMTLRRQWNGIKENEELRWYLIVVGTSILLIMWNILPMCSSVWEAFRYSSFQVSSIITTTGYGTADFNLWPSLSRNILVVLMIVGACAGSTGGGIKVSRLIILFKSLKREISRVLHPNLVKRVKMEGRAISDEIVRNTLVFFFAYILIVVFSILLVSLDGYDLVTSATSVFATISNIGPGLELVGPVGNFSMFSGFAKLVLTFCMLAGRLEIFPVLIVFSPRAWRRDF